MWLEWLASIHGYNHIFDHSLVLGFFFTLAAQKRELATRAKLNGSHIESQCCLIEHRRKWWIGAFTVAHWSAWCDSIMACGVLNKATFTIATARVRQGTFEYFCINVQTLMHIHADSISTRNEFNFQLAQGHWATWIGIGGGGNCAQRTARVHERASEWIVWMRYIRSGFVNFSTGAQHCQTDEYAHLIHSFQVCRLWMAATGQNNCAC